MAKWNAVTILAGRFDGPLSKGDDRSTMPAGATLAAAGTEVAWDGPEGLARRVRDVRVWIALWPDLEAAQNYFSASADHPPILADAIEHTAILAVPFACHGELNWTPDGQAPTLYPNLASKPVGLGPVLVMTSLGLGPTQDGLREFGQGVQAVRAAYAKNPAVLMDVNMLPDLPMIDGPTLTLWRSERDIVKGAYRTEPHKTAMKLRGGALARASFTRMAVEAARGSWNGVDLNKVTAG